MLDLWHYLTNQNVPRKSNILNLRGYLTNWNVPHKSNILDLWGYLINGNIPRKSNMLNLQGYLPNWNMPCKSNLLELWVYHQSAIFNDWIWWGILAEIPYVPDHLMNMRQSHLINRFFNLLPSNASSLYLNIKVSAIMTEKTISWWSHRWTLHLPQMHPLSRSGHVPGHANHRPTLH